MRSLAVVLALLIPVLAGAADEGAVYVTASDTAAFGPVTALSRTGFPGKWYQRAVAFAARGDRIFNLQAGSTYPDLICRPRLTGRWDIWVNLREVNYLTGMQLKLSGRELAWTITPALGTLDVHTNRDILVARDVAMDGQTLLLHHIGRLLYFSYLKFVPAGTDPAAQVDPARVREEPLLDPRAEWREGRETIPEGLTELTHESLPPAQPATDPSGRGYVLFTRPYLDLIFPDTVPDARDVVTELRVSAAQGEYEPVTFSVRAARDLGACRVTVEDLRAGKAVISRQRVDVAVVRLRNLRTAFNGKTFMRAPATLDSALPAPVPAGQTTQFWLTVHVPPDAAPGNYESTVTFTPAQGAPARLPLRLRVWPFALREPRDVACGMYDQLWAATTSPDWLQERFAGMRAHGLTTVGYCGALNGEIALRDGQAAVVFDGSCGFEYMMDAYRDAGFPHPVLWLMGDDLWDWCSRQAPVGSERFRELYRQVARSILAECDRRRWLRPVFQPVDEPGSYEVRPAAAHIARWGLESQLLHEAGAVVEVDHIPFTTTDPRLQAALAQALPVTDVFTQRFSNRNLWFVEDGWWWDNMKPQVAQWGKQLWSYNINDAAFFPELATYRLAFGHFLWRQGIKGQIMWAYQGAVGNPLNCLDGAYTDFMYAYPAIPQAGESGGPTLMWECIREGRDDYNYVHTLRVLLDGLEQRGQTARAARGRELLQRLDASFDDERLRRENRFLECQWQETATGPGGRRVARGQFNIPNGWRLGDYDDWRAQIAREIVRLQAGD